MCLFAYYARYIIAALTLKRVKVLQFLAAVPVKVLLDNDLQISGWIQSNENRYNPSYMFLNNKEYYRSFKYCTSEFVI